jgi:L-seryl-tRNA(Ser) seleniumtransferase
MSATKQYPRDIDHILGYTPGTIIPDEVTEYRSVRAAQQVMLHRYREHGIEGIHNLMGLVDDSTVPDFFEGPAYQERFLGTVLMEEELTGLARRHLGGDEGYTSLVFNRVTAGTITVTQALVPPGSVVPYVVPPYPGIGGHGHPSVPRAVDLARSFCPEVTSPQALEDLLKREPQVPLVVVCSSYRGALKEEELRGVCEVAHAKGIPVYVDDASGARTRTAVYDQRPAGELGADLIMTSCEKAAFFGPRAGLLLGRADLMDHIGAKANMMGTEARPSVVAAVLQTLQEYTPERGRELFAEWLERSRGLWELAKPFLGEKLQYGAYDGIYLPLDAFMEMVMERAGMEETDLAPVDLSIAHAMLMLRGFGFLSVASLHYPGASKLVSVKPNSLREGDDISDEAIVEGVVASMDALVRILPDRAALERVLFSPPE